MNKQTNKNQQKFIESFISVSNDHLDFLPLFNRLRNATSVHKCSDFNVPTFFQSIPSAHPNTGFLKRKIDFSTV